MTGNDRWQSPVIIPYFCHGSSVKLIYGAPLMIKVNHDVIYSSSLIKIDSLIGKGKNLMSDSQDLSFKRFIHNAKSRLMKYLKKDIMI